MFWMRTAICIQRSTKSMVSIEQITNKYDVLELKEMIKDHVAYTNSVKGKEILENFGEYLPKFKKIIPHDYNRMLMAIVQMEEKGLSSEQAQIEAFYANQEEDRRVQQWENQQDLWNMKGRSAKAVSPKRKNQTF